ncbi:MAG: L-idonate 5-dehydrogenase [Pseudomonadota bacterium]
MKSVVIHGARDLRIEEREVSPPGPGEVEITVKRGGICGSDLHYYQHGGFGTVKLKEPMILGHEVAGEISAIGPDVNGLNVGQLVAVSPSRPCGACKYCQAGQQNHCMNMRFYGSAMPFPHIQGAFRQTLIADASQCAPADGLTAAQAAMAEPLAVCLHAAKQAGPLMGKRILVTGCGPIGLLCILVARRAGATEIVATDLTDFTLKTARTIGADAGFHPQRDAEHLAAFERDKGTFDVLFECTGVAAALAGALPTLCPGGIIVQLGLGGDMTLPVQAMTAKELQLRGSFRFHEEFFTGVSLMQKQLINVDPLLTHSLKLDEAQKAFELASDRTQALKAQLDFT